MTIRVCRNSFNRNLDILGKGLWIFARISIMGIFFSSLILSLIGFNPICVGLVGELLEYCWDSLFNPLIIVMGISGLFGYTVFFAVPWIDDEENILTKMNRKFGLFSWRDDC